jgi:hypothetical protein
MPCSNEQVQRATPAETREREIICCIREVFWCEAEPITQVDAVAELFCGLVPK